MQHQYRVLVDDTVRRATKRQLALLHLKTKTHTVEAQQDLRRGTATKPCQLTFGLTAPGSVSCTAGNGHKILMAQSICVTKTKNTYRLQFGVVQHEFGFQPDTRSLRPLTRTTVRPLQLDNRSDTNALTCVP